MQAGCAGRNLSAVGGKVCTETVNDMLDPENEGEYILAVCRGEGDDFTLCLPVEDEQDDE